jgi:hypothetical protein
MLSLRTHTHTLSAYTRLQALLNPYYRPEWVNAPVPAALPNPQKEKMLESKRAAGIAHLALDGLLADGPGGGQAMQLTEAVISK